MGSKLESIEGSVIASYMRAVDAGDLAGIASHFTEDALYFRPKLIDGKIVEGFEFVRGPQEISDFFARRGRPVSPHRFVSFSRNGSTEMAYGIGPNGGGDKPDCIFLSMATLSDDGKISRYISNGLPTTSDQLRELGLTSEGISTLP